MFFDFITKLVLFFVFFCEPTLIGWFINFVEQIYKLDYAADCSCKLDYGKLDSFSFEL